MTRNNTKLLSYGSGSQKSEMGFSWLKPSCGQGWFICKLQERVVLFPTSKSHPRSGTYGPTSIFKASSREPSNSSLTPTFLPPSSGDRCGHTEHLAHPKHRPVSGLLTSASAKSLLLRVTEYSLGSALDVDLLKVNVLLTHPKLCFLEGPGRAKGWALPCRQGERGPSFLNERH